MSPNLTWQLGPDLATGNWQLETGNFMQSYKNHVHRPVLTVVGYLFVAIALVEYLMRLRAADRQAIAPARVMRRGDRAAPNQPQPTRHACRIGSSSWRCASGPRRC